MGTIIPLHGDPHQMTQELLPWYANGTLEPGEQRLVEDHLAACAECRAELESEQRRARAFVALADAPADLPVPTPPVASRAAPPERFNAGRLALIAASQVAIIGASLGLYSTLTAPAAPDYHALSAPLAAAPAGNIIVVFRPDISEQALRATLNAAQARIVDGPTAADAYVLSVAPAKVGETVAMLRTRRDIVLAQPIDTALNR